MAIEQLGGNTTEGCYVGPLSTSKVGFFGATSINQPTGLSAYTGILAGSTGSGFGFSTQAQADNLAAAVTALIIELRRLGLIV